MSRGRGFLFILGMCFAAACPIGAGFAQCNYGTIQQSQKQAAISASEYAKQIELAREAALEIYDHGFVGNSDSAINNKVGHPPGMSVAVAVAGKIVWAEGFGVADLEQCVPATPRTRFRIVSTSKPLTSAAAALLF